ncbi:coproporphyrinogen III oxidase [Sporosarcina pasteurii]|uniref:Oxygen-independent coproporphyrinogen-III oxidase 2 n=1 Tax=Sporosarcina pasteurii TaxID=1474 RepID=A0A380CAV5_SPOPA|nr:coproporphyrinogen III oxidase [Sporosarcina pasteurii]MDS9472661.1 coproporphyrinogen III oxidase [Sporosarcina pasteurii]QBQ04321.1 coproporphyrinogen III oxidase [Sporosarcina pasteurii]SUJ15970.1 Oxygen-independent coproporphyrinogen-III oxidase 2 [Sporosarcina pasteurii]
MQKIKVDASFAEDWIRMFAHLANLFFEQCEIITKEDSEAMDVHFTIEHQPNGEIVGQAKLITKESEFVATFSEQAVEGEQRLINRQLKRIHSHVFLEVLEQATEMTQSWGILTGIRPMKLYHKYRQEGLSSEQAIENLMTNYRVSREKSELLAHIASIQKKAVPDLYDLKKEVSIYIGIPFCPTKCAYCTFPAYAIRRTNGRVDSFLDGLHEEIREMGKWLSEKDMTITTIYFGGGTPTSIEAEEMDALYKTMYDSFPNMDKVREITVEAGRPDTITPEKIDVLKKWGIDRISVNPQSYTDETLKAIGRHHTVQETIDKFWLSRNMGMKNINMDLIIGLPNEGMEEFEHSLQETAKMQPESLTIHTLSFKRASAMSQNRERYKVADRKTVERMMKRGEKWTAENGYHPYYLYRQKNILGNLENVGYSKPGEESIYNIVIMEEVQTIIGVGCGASSKFIHPETGKITQFYNPKDPAAYIMTYDESIEKKLAHLDAIFPTVEKPV